MVGPRAWQPKSIINNDKLRPNTDPGIQEHMTHIKFEMFNFCSNIFRAWVFVQTPKLWTLSLAHRVARPVVVPRGFHLYGMGGSTRVFSLLQNAPTFTLSDNSTLSGMSIDGGVSRADRIFMQLPCIPLC